jgi:hypothetical protein
LNIPFSKIQDFISQANDSFEKRVVDMKENLRKQVSIIPTGNFDSYLFKYSVKKLDFYTICCLSWYLPEESRILLQLDLKDKCKKLPSELRIRGSLLLNSRPEMLNYILNSDTIGRNPNEFFGIIKGKLHIRVRLIFRKNRKVKKSEFHRGYRDHGSRVPIHERHSDYQNDYTAKEQQIQIEENRDSDDDIASFLQGLLQ